MSLIRLALFSLVLAIIMIVVAPFDTRIVLGINPWIKPIKFALSFVLFLATMGWILAQLEIPPASRRRFEWVFGLVFAVEMFVIVSQAARGTTSHFNDRSLYDGILFSFMGMFILLNTAAIARLAYLFFTCPTRVSGPLLWGIRAGLVVSLLAFLDGGIMVYLRAHTVGMADGGPGVPMLNWSTRAGDLRLSHFLALHALQALPLLGWLLARRPSPSSRAWFTAGTALYAIAVLGFLVVALCGRPVFAGS